MLNRAKYINEAARTRAYNETVSMKVFCHAHPLSVMRPLLIQQNIIKATDLRRLPSGSLVRVIGLLVIVHTPPTKSGKRVMFLTMEDETGLIDVVVFPKAQKGFARTILTSEVLAVEGKLQKQGVKGISISIVMEKALTAWSGRLDKFLKMEVH
ncbi:MAG: OB-fold nucleic acid binding domain-containing protein [Deltaproteobacteria bacterium]|nr:OB-fold nucleic acid binding domain-containing protein [Deltaproteobacteria bacterium]